MRLFWKHIMRSFLRRPFQPLLILLTVVCATSIIVSGLQISIAFTEHSHEVMDGDREVGDILITMRGDSDQRILFPEDAERVIGERGRVLGEFRLSGFLEGTANEPFEEPFVNLSAVDLERADAFYQFRYTGYGVFTEKNLGTSAIISESMASKCGLSVGDVITLRILDTRFSYTVQAIAEESGLFKERDMLVPIGSLRQTLASRIPTVASLGSAFAPATRLMIRVNAESDLTVLQDVLSDDPAFAKMSVSRTGNEDGFLFLALMQNIVLWLPCILLLFLSALMLISCMNFLHAQRSEETALFCAVGASRRHLLLLTVAESGLYGLVGSLLGLPIATRMLEAASGLYEWIEQIIRPEPLICLIGCGISLLLLLGCTLRHFMGRRQLSLAEELQQTAEVADEESRRKYAWIPPTLFLACSVVALLLLPTRLLYLPAIVMMLALVWLLYLSLSLLFQKVAALLQRILLRIGRPHAWLTMGLKNLYGSFALRHVGRVVSLFLALFATMTFSINVLQLQVDGLLDLVNADYVAAYADERTMQRIESMPEVEKTLRLSYFSAVSIADGQTAIGLSTKGDREGLLELDCYPATLPTGNEIAISKGLSVLTGKKVGDVLPVTVQGVSHVFTVSEILVTNMHLVVFDVETLGIQYDYLCIDTVSDDDGVRSHLSATLEERGAFLLASKGIFQAMESSVRAHITLLRIVIWISAGLILMGSVNLMIRQRRERRRERFILMSNGMTRAEIGRMYACEILLLLLIATAFASVGALLLTLVIDIGVRSFGMVLLL